MRPAPSRSRPSKILSSIFSVIALGGAEAGSFEPAKPLLERILSPAAPTVCPSEVDDRAHLAYPRRYRLCAFALAVA